MSKSNTGLVFGILLILLFSLVAISLFLYLLNLGGYIEKLELYKQAGYDIQIFPHWFYYARTIFGLLISIGTVVSGVGLILAKEWARKYSIIISYFFISLFIIQILSYLLGFTIMRTDDWVGGSTAVLFLGLMIFFLTKSKVKQEFKN